MKYKDFLKIGVALERQEAIISASNELGIDVIDMVEGYNVVIEALIKEVYGTEGLEWFTWFCYEADFGRKDWSKSDTYIKNDDGTMTNVRSAGEDQHGAIDSDGNPICYDWKSLWEYLEKLL